MILPRVTIIMPVVNEAPQLARHLKALQPLRAYCQVTLVDGGSKDGSAAIAATMIDQVFYTAPRKALQMNVGANRTNGEILLFLSANAHLPDNAIKQMLQAVNKGSQWGRFEVGFDSSHVSYRWLAAVINWCARVTGIMLSQQALFMTREAFQRVGGFPDIALLECAAISVRLKKIGSPAYLHDTAIFSVSGRQRLAICRSRGEGWRLWRSYFFGTDFAVGCTLLSLIVMLMGLLPENILFLLK